MFWPKFHPELSFSELCWAAWKRLLRKWCDYTTASLKENAPDSLFTQLELSRCAPIIDTAATIYVLTAREKLATRPV